MSAEILGSKVSSRTRPAMVAAFLLLVLAGLGAVGIAFGWAEADNQGARSRVVRRTQFMLFSAVQDAETGQRGYLLTGDISYLAPFQSAQERIPVIEAQLTDLIADNPAQQQRLAELKSYIAQKMAELQDTLIAAKDRGLDAALAIVKTNVGRDTMTKIRNLNAAFDEAELKLISHHQDEAVRQRVMVIGLIVASLLLAGMLAVFVGIEARRISASLAEHNRRLQSEMSDREQAESQLRHAQKMKSLGQLTGGIAHDFNNMLAVIIGNLDLLKRRWAPEDDLYRFVENALGGAHRASALTQRLLAFSRLQPLEPKTTDINKCIGDISELIRRSLGEQIVVETVQGGGVWRALVDASQLESAILNIAVNSRDAMPKGGKLTIETANAALDRAYTDQIEDLQPGQYVLISITDTGTGMSADVMAKAFDPFFTTKEVGRGTGLGLSQVYGFVKQSGGHIQIYSEVNVGTTIKIYLPRDMNPTAAAAKLELPKLSSIDGRFTVLVVEDDPAVRAFTVNAVRELGFLALEADAAETAMACLDRYPEVSLLLTDVVMAGTNGRELADAAVAAHPGLRVVYMTGYTKNAIVHNGMLDLGTRLLTKPFTLAQLDRELRDALADHLE